IHAALPGVVRRVNHSASRSGGRYVIIDHPGGYATYYFHLDRIHPNLISGIGLSAGEALGTLGTTGIDHSAPHLHFQVAKRNPTGSFTFVDPEPMLRRAVVLDDPAPMPAADPDAWSPPDSEIAAEVNLPDDE